MIKLNRTTEYGLMALRYMSRQGSERVSAREIADLYGLPFEITAKTLQRLKDSGLIQSAQGAHGGYTLGRPLTETTLAEFIQVMEGPQYLVSCADPEAAVSSSKAKKSSGGCEYSGKCEIRSVLGDLNARFHTFLAGIRLAELVGETPVQPIARVSHGA